MRSSGSSGRLVRIGHAGELGDLAGPGLGVQALHVARLAVFERGRDVDFDEVVDPAAHLVTDGAVGGDRRGDRHHAVAREQRRDETDPEDVRVAVGLGETEPLRQVLAHLVAVEQLDPPAPLTQVLDQDLGDRALAGAREPGEPHAAAGRCRLTGWSMASQDTGSPAWSAWL